MRRQFQPKVSILVPTMYFSFSGNYLSFNHRYLSQEALLYPVSITVLAIHLGKSLSNRRFAIRSFLVLHVNKCTAFLLS